MSSSSTTCTQAPTSSRRQAIPDARAEEVCAASLQMLVAKFREHIRCETDAINDPETRLDAENLEDPGSVSVGQRFLVFGNECHQMQKSVAGRHL